LLDEVSELLCRAACDWVGVPLSDAEARGRARDLVAIVEGAGKLDRRHWFARRARARSAHWARGLVRAAREHHGAEDTEASALDAIASHRDLDGQLITEEAAGDDLLSILRPTVAVARWVVFLAVALHTHAGARERLASGEWEYDWFIEEVRRFYPFFPFMPGRTRQAFEWGGLRFPAGRRLLMDIYGTNRDPDRWDDP